MSWLGRAGLSSPAVATSSLVATAAALVAAASSLVAASGLPLEVTVALVAVVGWLLSVGWVGALVGSLPGEKMEKEAGGGNRARTGDLLAASQTLSQLSYTPTVGHRRACRRSKSIARRDVRATIVDVRASIVTLAKRGSSATPRLSGYPVRPARQRPCGRRRLRARKAGCRRFHLRGFPEAVLLRDLWAVAAVDASWGETYNGRGVMVAMSQEA